MTKLLNIKETSKALGYTEKTLYMKVHKRQIEHVKIGRKVFFKQETIEKMIQDGTISPVVLGIKNG